MLPSVYDYTCFSTYVAAYIKGRKAVEKTFSFRKLSLKMGLASPSTLAMVASGRRAPTTKMLHKFAHAIRLSKNELDYAETLIQLQKSADARERGLYAERLRQLKPGAETVVIALDTFEFIANWYHIAILEMTSLADFSGDPAALAARLGGRITEAQAEDAVERLLRLGLLKKDPDGALRKTSLSFKSPSGIPNTAIRKFHSEMLDLAKGALTEQSVDERYIAGQTMTIRKDKLPEAKRLIQEFLEKMRSLVPEEAAGDETYHLGLQYFRLTAPAAAPAGGSRSSH